MMLARRQYGKWFHPPRATQPVLPAGMQGRLDPADAESIEAFEGREAGAVRALDPATGKTVGEVKPAAAPVWNGLAAARGRLYVSCVNGTVVRLAGPE